MSVLSVTKQDFDEKVLNSSQAVLVDFWAEWCGPCKAIAPILDDVATEFADKVKVVKVNIDEQPELAARFGIRSIPTLLVFKDGGVANNMTGAVPKSRIVEWLKSSL